MITVKEGDDIPDDLIIDPKRKTKIMTHGFVCRVSQFPKPLIDAYLKAGKDYNMIVINWFDLSNGMEDGAFWAAQEYIKATYNCISVGKQAAAFLGKLVKKFKLNPKDIHAIGHSLGAHTVGFLGRQFQKLGFGTLNRITGLDPAGVFFRAKKDTLWKTDATFVDVIHTATDYWFKGGFGITKPLGHIDFYPNGGLHQPGCTEKGVFGSFEGLAGPCSHVRVIKYYVESLEHPFKGGTFCESWKEFKKANCLGNPQVEMGESCQEHFERINPPSGSYFLKVNAESPFCKFLTERDETEAIYEYEDLEEDEDDDEDEDEDKRRALESVDKEKLIKIGYGKIFEHLDKQDSMEENPK